CAFTRSVTLTIVQAPQVSVTLRVNAQMTKEAALEMLKAVAEINNITVTESPNIIRLVGPPPAPRTPATPTLTPQQQALLAGSSRPPVINMIRLKNLVASEIQPVLMSLFTGTGGGFGNVGGRGVNNALPGAVGGGRGAQQQQQQGRGGGAGGRAGQAAANAPIIF